MRPTFLTASAKIVFCLVWFGVFRQDTFAELIADTKTAKDAPENVYSDDVVFYTEPEHLSLQDPPLAIVETIIHQTMYVPLQPSFPSSHIKDIFLGSSPQKRELEFSPMDKKTEMVWSQEPNLKSAGNSKTPRLTTQSPHLSFEDLLKSLQPAEIKEEDQISLSEPLITFLPEDDILNASMKDDHQEEIDSLFTSSSESEEDNHYFNYWQKAPKSQNSYKDLLLELSLKNNDASSLEHDSKESTSSSSSFNAATDSNKLIANPKVVESLSDSDDTTASVGSSSTKPTPFEKFLNLILPILLSPASFDITFPGNETEGNPLTETTENVEINSK